MIKIKYNLPNSIFMAITKPIMIFRIYTNVCFCNVIQIDERKDEIR